MKERFIEEMKNMCIKWTRKRKNKQNKSGYCMSEINLTTTWQRKATKTNTVARK